MPEDETPPPAVSTSPVRTSPTRARRIGVSTLVVVSAVLMLGAVVAGWMKLQLLDTDTWVETSEQSLDEPEVQQALSTTLVDTASETADPQARLEAALPPNLDPFAGPLAGALRRPGYDAAERALASEQVSQVWAIVNRAAHERLIAVVVGDAPIVASTGSEVTIDLRALVAQIGTRIGVGQLDGSRIPAEAATVSLPNSDGVATAIEGLRRLDRLALTFALLAIVTLAAGLWLGRGIRRHALMVWGVSLILVGLVLHVALNAGRGWLPTELAHSASWQDALTAIYDVATVQVHLGANALVLVGIIVLAGTWVLGATRPAVSLRRMSAPALREHELLGWLGFGVVLFAMLQLVPAFSSRTPSGLLLLVALALVGFWALRRELLAVTPLEAVAVEQPVALPAELATPDAQARLARLVDLRARGVIDDSEFETARGLIIEREERRVRRDVAARAEADAEQVPASGDGSDVAT
jgi:hypothetical protein